MLCGDLNGKEISKKRSYVYMYSWFTSLYSRNEHDIVKQLYSKKIFLMIFIKLCGLGPQFYDSSS